MIKIIKTELNEKVGTRKQSSCADFMAKDLILGQTLNMHIIRACRALGRLFISSS